LRGRHEENVRKRYEEEMRRMYEEAVGEGMKRQ